MPDDEEVFESEDDIYACQICNVAIVYTASECPECGLDECCDECMAEHACSDKVA